MSHVAQILSERFRQIRKQTSGTQERFATDSGLSQAYISQLENSRAWGSIENVAIAIRRAGGDPEDLVNARDGVADLEIAEIRVLLPQVDRDVRLIVLQLLRREVAIKKATKATEEPREGNVPK
jgi:transcriptional regulator with XRE-family HTH domain